MISRRYKPPSYANSRKDLHLRPMRHLFHTDLRHVRPRDLTASPKHIGDHATHADLIPVYGAADVCYIRLITFRSTWTLRKDLLVPFIRP